MSFSYLFGQLFLGNFSYLATSVGLSGLLVTAMSGKYVEKGFVQSAVVISLCGVVLIGLLYYAVDYYTTEQLPGSSFPNTLTFLFGAAVLALIIKAIMKFKEKLKIC